jgi:hypothetical protein
MFATVAAEWRSSTMSPLRRFDMETALANASLGEAVEAGFTGVDRLMVVLDGVPGEIPYQWGTTYLRLLAVPIPRSLWPSKPGMSEATVYAPLFGTDVGMFPASYIGDLHVNGDVLGVVVGMCLLAVIHACADAWALIHRANPGSILFYAPVAFYCGPAFNNVSIVCALFLLSAAAVVVATCCKSRARRRRLTSVVASGQQWRTTSGQAQRPTAIAAPHER